MKFFSSSIFIFVFSFLFFLTFSSFFLSFSCPQAEMSLEDTATKHTRKEATVTSQQRVAGTSIHAHRGRPLSVLRGTGSKTAADKGSTGWTAKQRLVRVDSIN